jgi:hypothetical protein
MTIERLSADQVALPMAAGHRTRYELAAGWCHVRDLVNDVACGIGYGAMAFSGVDYHGYDRPGVPDARFSVVRGTTTFHECDLDLPDWKPLDAADVTCCFETLEHVREPVQLARTLSRYTKRLLFISVPTVPTVASNPTHRTDFTVDDIPRLFPDHRMVMRWAQPEELAHIWLLACP